MDLNKCKKNLYQSPLVYVSCVKIEESVAAGSYVAVMGGNNSDYTPDVDDWIEFDEGTNGIEF